jgi:hypothetical protein
LLDFSFFRKSFLLPWLEVKKVLSIMVLFILLVNVAGFYAYYVVQLNRIHKEVREALILRPDNEFEILVLSNDAYQKSIVEEGEIRVNNKMYDVARITNLRDSVKVYALHDGKEEDLQSLLNEIVSKPLNGKSAVPNAVLLYLSLVFITPAHDIIIGTNDQEEFLTTSYCFSMKPAVLLQETPPPWIF